MTPSFSYGTSMTEKSGSELRSYSVAIVANNKELGSNLIQATPVEKLTMLDGEIVSLPTDVEAAGNSADGESYQTKVKTDLAVEAKWIPFAGSNRITPPDVRRGERVMLMQFADNNDYYWHSLGLDDHLRKLETVIFRISATADENADSLLPENSYYVEASSHSQNITIRTSKANGEFCAYGFQFNLKDGLVLLTDDLGNEFAFDSKNTHLYLKNVEGTLVELNKKNIKAYAPDKIELEAVNLIAMKAEAVTIESQTYSLKTGTYSMECSTGTIKGNITFQNQVTFQQRTQHNGITSTASIVGPSETI